MRWWGIDGGQTGAGLRIAEDGLTCLELIEWSRTRDAPRLPIESGDVVAVEAVYIGENPRSALALQLWRGKLIGTFPPGVRLLEPLATDWRAKVFRRARMRRDAAKAAAIELVRRHALGMPAEYSEHAAEAWCMARYVHFWALAHLNPDGTPLRSKRRR